MEAERKAIQRFNDISEKELIQQYIRYSKEALGVNKGHSTAKKSQNHHKYIVNTRKLLMNEIINKGLLDYNQNKNTVKLRASWEMLGIEDRLQKRFTRMIATEEAFKVYVITASLLANELIADWLIYSISTDTAFDKLQMVTDLKGTHIPCGRTDFYAYRRIAYAYLAMLLSGQKVQMIL